MAQYDLHFTQNVAPSGLEFSEKFVTLIKGGLLSRADDGSPSVLSPGVDDTQMLVPDSSSPLGLKWVDRPSHHEQNTDTGTDNPDFQVDNLADGPRIKNVGGSLNIRNAADTALANLVAANATFDKVTVNAAPSSGSELTNKDYVDGLLGANDAMVFKGTIGTEGTATSLPTSYGTGWTYRVITAGTYAGIVCEVGDLLIALVDREGTGNADADWTVVQTNIDGAVTGPSSSISNESIAIWDSNNRSIKSSGKVVSDFALAADYVSKSLFDANSLLVADADNTPKVLPVGASSFVGRNATGGITALSAEVAKQLLALEDADIHPDAGATSIEDLSGNSVLSGVSVNSKGHVTGLTQRELTFDNLDAMQSWVAVPASKTSVGTEGQMAKDDNYFYICTLSGAEGAAAWKRSPIATNW